MTDRTCERCDGPMPIMARSHARYCKPACRAAAGRARKAVPTLELPVALTRLPRWVRRSESKVPLTITGTPAASNDPATWSDFDAASKSSVGAGLGFVFNGDGLCVIDLDHCLIDGEPTPAAAAFLATVPDTYMEISPSGDGLHVFGKGIYLTARKSRREDLPGEVIAGRKYVTVTGRRFRGTPLTLANIAAPAGALIN